jgi:hypothetical protein
MRQRQRCIDGFVYSAGASGDVMGSLLVGNAIYGQHLFSSSNTTTCDSDIHTQLLHLKHPVYEMRNRKHSFISSLTRGRGQQG